MQGLAETLRQQQELNDDTFSDLQEQFNEGQPGGQGQQGQQPGQQFGQGQGQQPGQQPGQQFGEGQGQEQGDLGRSLADRQRALRDELARQQGNLPGAGTPEGDAARDALDRAGRAMDGAEDALREEDFAGALDRQAEAMEALREGMRNLGEAMAQQQEGQGEQGEGYGTADGSPRDPLGRLPGSQGRIGTDEQLLQGEDVYRRARELLDEIRRRSGEQQRCPRPSPRRGRPGGRAPTSGRRPPRRTPRAQDRRRERSRRSAAPPGRPPRRGPRCRGRPPVPP
jgi:hypothetical protein